ncbi:C39 family peptidase [Streptomyces sp. PBH53]|uniref:C39 family peptidase n=1 Tax=Streptomyces sp. PBH53 TaxID=1577075 RepID=UPI001AD84C5A|nr:C39 family peptidase [Streptomyces sp. PBH53]
MPEEFIHPVPYYAQWASPELTSDIVLGRLPAAADPRWAEYGASSPDEYAWWAKRLCGVACLRMCLNYWGFPVPAPMDVARDCIEAGAYVRHAEGLYGLIYAPFADFVNQRWGLQAQSMPDLTPRQVRSSLKQGGLALLSVHPTIRFHGSRPQRRGGHLVLAVGFEGEDLIIHNPSGLFGVSQEFARVTPSDLDASFARRGVLLGGPGPLPLNEPP